VASASISKDRTAARIAAVNDHIRLENEHDLEGVLRTFGDTAQYHDEAWGEHYAGRNGVRGFYEQLMKALPDLEIDVQRRHVADDAILVEVIIRGTHLGRWRGLPATGRRLEFPLCGVYTFDADDRLAGEKIYYDRGEVAATRCLPRAAKRVGTDRYSSHSPRHDCACFRAQAPTQLARSSGTRSVGQHFSTQHSRNIF
jgi:steroid delta-isomerase-like uncharacterized protein